MIDYEKIKLAHELAEKEGAAIYYTYKNSDGNYVSGNDLDQLLLEMTRMNQPKQKYKVGQEVWVKSYSVFNEGHMSMDAYKAVVIPFRDCDYRRGEDLIRTICNGDEYVCGESFVYPSREALIESQIQYWTKLKNECHHQDDGNCYTSHPSMCKCIKCGEFYR